MHIPDGYLSPSTCAVLYAGAAPFWYVALKRLRRELNTRMIPLLALFAAFSFVIMMFNLPLPGGTTGHAVGMGIAAIVAGPWASIIAISVALFLQAIFFGDGGITAIGANCFNMAIVGSLVAFAVYRVLSYGASGTSARRVIAAGLAGYTAINASALCAAVEFGIQPILFHDAAGAPLYCPYPLSISIPAMMLGHLTFAGLAEFIVTAGVFAYLQRTESDLIVVPTRTPWIALGALVLLTPLGILAVGSAWGEWAPTELPGQAPAGLQRLFTLWNAPLARYTPSFIPNAFAGYLVSAVLGVGVIFLVSRVALAVFSQKKKRRPSFVEKTSLALADAVQQSLFADDFARSDGFLQRLDPRVKLAGILALIIAAVSVRQLWMLTILLAGAVALAVVSHIPLRVLATRVWLPVLAFTGLIAVPALFLTSSSSAAFLILRAETASTLSVILILSTLWTHLLKALRSFRAPVVLVVILGMTYRYIFVLLATAQDMFESRRSRMLGQLESRDARRLAAGSAGVLLGKTMRFSNDVHTAMLARGFRGEVYVLDDFRAGRTDALALCGLVAVAAVAVWFGR